jgi:serine-threonine kinase receptor-associated protein
MSIVYGQHIACWGHTRPLTEVNFVSDSPGKHFLISSAHDKHPQIRDGESGDWIGSFHGHRGAVWSCKVDTLTRTLAATASGDFSAKLWSVTTGRELCEIGAHKHVVKSLDFTNDSLMIATGCQDGLVRLFNTASPQKSTREIRISSGKSDDCVTKLYWTDPSNNTILLSKKNGRIELHDLRQADKTEVSYFETDTKLAVIDLELNPQHNCVMACSGNSIFNLSWNELKILKEYTTPDKMHFKSEGGLSLSPDGTKIMAGASDLDLREFDVRSGEVLRTFKGHHAPIRCVKYHPSGNIVASGSEDGTIRLWGLKEAETDGKGEK